MTYTGTKESTPATPASNKYKIFLDTADNKLKLIDYNGIVQVLTTDGHQDRNIIMNGGFAIQQRVAIASTAIPSISLTTRAGQVADRWAVTTGNVTTTSWAQIDSSAAIETGLNAKFYGKITQATNAAKVILSQFIINREMAHLRGTTVRLQCKIKQFAGSNQTYKLGLLQLNSSGATDVSPQFISAIGADTVDPTWGANLVLIAPNASPVGDGGSISGNWLSITSTANWARGSATFTIPSTAKNLMPVLLKDAAGGATDSFGIAEFGLYQSPEIRDWVSEPFADQLLKCQQYFCKTFPYATVPAQAAGLNTGEIKWMATLTGAGAGRSPTWYFPVEMWKTPVTTTAFSPNTANNTVRDETGALDASAATIVLSGTKGLAITCTGNASSAVGNLFGVHVTADAETVN